MRGIVRSVTVTARSKSAPVSRASKRCECNQVQDIMAWNLFRLVLIALSTLVAIIGYVWGGLTGVSMWKLAPVLLYVMVVEYWLLRKGSE